MHFSPSFLSSQLPALPRGAPHVTLQLSVLTPAAAAGPPNALADFCSGLRLSSPLSPSPR